MKIYQQYSTRNACRLSSTPRQICCCTIKKVQVAIWFERYQHSNNFECQLHHQKCQDSCVVRISLTLTQVSKSYEAAFTSVLKQKGQQNKQSRQHQETSATVFIMILSVSSRLLYQLVLEILQLRSFNDSLSSLLNPLNRYYKSC